MVCFAWQFDYHFDKNREGVAETEWLDFDDERTANIMSLLQQSKVLIMSARTLDARQLPEPSQVGESPAPHYVALGYRKRQKYWLFEQNSSGYQQTRIGSRVPRRIENFYFAAQGGRCIYTAAWRSFAEA